LDKILN